MEFYKNNKKNYRCAYTFQFPTGWNSTLLARLFLCICIGFNSQRDGILLWEISNFRPGHVLFQFPTGWNSTFVDLRRSWNSLLFQFPTGWNSTRNDFLRYTRLNVSIPNGMEFYTLHSPIPRCS